MDERTSSSIQTWTRQMAMNFSSTEIIDASYKNKLSRRIICGANSLLAKYMN